jgi:hypothetical protein
MAYLVKFVVPIHLATLSKTPCGVLSRFPVVGGSPTTNPSGKVSPLRIYFFSKSAGKKNPMFGKSAVAGRKWYNDGIKTYYLFPNNPATLSLNLGRKKPTS